MPDTQLGGMPAQHFTSILHSLGGLGLHIRVRVSWKNLGLLIFTITSFLLQLHNYKLYIGTFLSYYYSIMTGDKNVFSVLCR
jgi:hypothetical protein